MWEVILNLAFFLSGIAVGKNSLLSRDNLSDLNDKLNQSEELKSSMHANWIMAEDKAETWKRRYDNLLFHVNTTSGGKNE